MKLRDPIARLPTHGVVNMPPHLGDQDLWVGDEPLRAWTAAVGGGGHADHLARVGRLAPRYRGAFGTLPKGCDLDGVIARVAAGY